MDLKNIVQNDKVNYMNTFGNRTQLAVSHGKGVYLYDNEGKEYLDLYAGIAVSSLGHAHPVLVNAICRQAEKIIHCSNIYYNEPQTKLAGKINKLAGTRKGEGYKTFFCNSGAEANEAAIKLARAFFSKKNMPHKNEIITMKNSFHGRTLTTITATGQEKFQKHFAPLTPGFKYVEKNDFSALVAAVDENTCAVMLEIIQGESGVHELSPVYLHEVRKLCDEKNILLIVDEIQTGVGRTGKMFAYQGIGIEPDIFTLAKGLAGGVPIGAACAVKTVVDTFEPGDHGTTFGGNPLACTAALAVLDTIEDENLLENVSRVGEYFSKRLNVFVQEGFLREVRGKGFMIGIGLKNTNAPEIKQKLMEMGFLVGNVGLDTIRILPSLILTETDTDKFIDALKTLL